MTFTCDACGIAFDAKRATARYCGSKCRTRSYRAAKKESTPPQPSKKLDALERYELEFAELAELLRLGDVEAATRRDLESAGRLDTPAGQRALVLARLIDHPPFGTYASVAGWSREHASSLAVALINVDVPAAKSALELARERRSAKRPA